MISCALEGRQIKWELSASFLLCLSSNLLNISNKAQLGHLLRDSTGNNTSADPASPRQTHTPVKHSPRCFTYYFQLSVCLSVLAGTCVQYLNWSSKCCETRWLDRLWSYLLERTGASIPPWVILCLSHHHTVCLTLSFTKRVKRISLSMQHLAGNAKYFIHLQRLLSCVCATELFRTTTVTRNMNLWVYCRYLVDVSQT